MTFAHPELLFLLLLLLPYMLWYFLARSKRKVPALRVASTEALRGVRHTARVHLMHLPFVLRTIAITMAIIAIARPQTRENWLTQTSEGINIMIALDVSSSMEADDFRPNRITAAKQVAQEFITGRSEDNIGLTTFAGEAFTQCPLTTDHNILQSILANTGTHYTQGAIDDGTAIGMGLSNAVARLQEAPGKSKVVILMTDGENNSGDISPLMAADIAKQLGIRVYTIGVAGRGGYNIAVPLPNGDVDYIPQHADDEIATDEMTQIAEHTGGKYFRATNNKKLQQIYAEIDRMERIKLKQQQHSTKHEAFMLFAWIGLSALLLEIVLRHTWLKRLI